MKGKSEREKGGEREGEREAGIDGLTESEREGRGRKCEREE